MGCTSIVERVDCKPKRHHLPAKCMVCTPFKLSVSTDNNSVCIFAEKKVASECSKATFFLSFTKVSGSFHVSHSLVGWAPILCRCLCCFCCFHSAQPWIPKWNCQNTFKMHTLFLCADTWKTVFSSCVCVCVRVCVSDPALLISSITASPPLSLPLAVCENAEPCAWRLMLDS